MPIANLKCFLFNIKHAWLIRISLFNTVLVITSAMQYTVNLLKAMYYCGLDVAMKVTHYPVLMQNCAALQV